MTAVGILGTGVVGQTLARKAAAVGHQVTVGARTATSESLQGFAADSAIATGSFADAAAAGGLGINATNGSNSLAALELAGSDNLDGKTLLDVSNDLEPVPGGFPKPVATADSSLALRIQSAYPNARVVKALNTMNCQVMVEPGLVPGNHLVFLSGDDDTAKEEVRALLRTFGWRDRQFLDLGGIDTAAAVEMMMAVWMRVRIARGMDAPPFNWAVNST